MNPSQVVASELGRERPSPIERIPASSTVLLDYPWNVFQQGDRA